MDFGKSRGWNVRVPKNYQTDPSVYHCKAFSDSEHGGKSKAKVAARKYRDQYLARTNQLHLVHPATFSARRSRIKDVRNTSGIIGLRLERQEKLLCNGGKSVYYSWNAYGSINKRHWRKSFAVTTHGERESFRLACQERYRRQGTLSVLGPLTVFPCRIPVPYMRVE